MGTGHLPLSAQLDVAGRTGTAPSSPLSLWTSYLHVWAWDKSSNIVCGQPTTQPPPLTLQFELPLESKCGYVCILLGVSEEGSDGPVRRNRQTHLIHLRLFVFLLPK